MSATFAPVGISEPRLRSVCGRVIPLPVDRWLAEPGPEEQAVLERCVPPVLDVGCGPARHTLALVRRGIPALGIDEADGAVRLARERGARVLRRTVFGRVPGEGSWGSALLLDGNVGIGGDPGTLLERMRGLLRSGGRVLAELDPPGVPTERLTVRLEFDGTAGSWFPWARVGVDDAAALASAAGLCLTSVWAEAGRWFGELEAR